MKDYILGLLGSADRKNAWQLAATQGAKSPYRFQHLLNDTVINIEALQENLVALAMDTLGKDGILTFDDTGFLKKGKKSAGVQRQYTGTAGRIENCQIGTFMGYKTDKGHTLLDAELYIPESWIQYPERCKEAKIPTSIEFKKKALQANEMYKTFRKTRT